MGFEQVRNHCSLNSDCIDLLVVYLGMYADVINRCLEILVTHKDSTKAHPLSFALLLDNNAYAIFCAVGKWCGFICSIRIGFQEN